MNVQNVVFRPYSDGEFWEGYAIDEGVFAYGDSLVEVRQDMREAMAFYFDVDVEDVELCEFHEHIVYEGSDDTPCVWVRTPEPLHDVEGLTPEQIDRVLKRRAVGRNISIHLEKNPDLAHSTFGNGTASTGDAIAAVALPDDLLASVLEQVGDTNRLYIAMQDDETDVIYWQCLVMPDADDFDPTVSRPLDDLGLSDATTVKEFMNATHASSRRSADYSLAA